MIRFTRSAMVLFLVAVAACGENGSLAGPLGHDGLGPAMDISDAAHLPGRDGFYFLPPMVAAPTFSGTFDPGLSPEVQVCSLVPATPPATGFVCGTVIKTFNGGSGAERITADLQGESYNALWNTKKNPSGLTLGQDKYRLEVYVGSTRLGYADLWFVGKSKDLKNVTDQYVGIVKDGTLTIKFRIETGMVGTVAVTPATAEIFGQGTQDFTATVTDLHGDPLEGLTVTWTSSDTDVATVAPTSGSTDVSGQTTTTASTATKSGKTIITASVQGADGIATLDVTLNRPPVAADDGYTIDEDNPLSVPGPGVLSNDSDPDGDAISAILDSDVANGTLALFSDGTISYTPDANFHGTDTFTYHAHDGTVDSNIATVTITVTPVNDAPVAVDDSYNTPEDTELLVPAPGILGNDTDVDVGDALTAALVTGPAHGTLTLNPDGSFSYDPALDFSGPDAFMYRVNDGALDSDPATVTITVTGVDDAPVAVDDAATVLEDAAATAIDVLANDTDSDGGAAKSIVSVTQPANGTVEITGGGSGLTYQPNANYCNDPPGTTPETFTYTLTPGGSTATVTVTVTCVNDVPVAVADAYSADEDVPLVVSALEGVLANDTDIDGGSLTAVKVTDPDNGTVTLNPDGSFTYTPNLNFFGEDSFTYKANDGSADSDVATVTITVNSQPDAPTAEDDAATVAEDASATIIDVLANDTDPDGIGKTIESVTQPANGTVVITNAGADLTYQPNANYCNAPPGSSLDTFTYTLSPGGLTATVRVTVTCVDDAPVAVADAATVDEDAGATAVDVLANDTDVDGGAISVFSVVQPSNGTVVITGGGTGLTYQPNANYCNDGTSTDDFTYTLAPGSSSTTVAVTVTCINDPPVAGADAFDFIGNTELRVDLSAVGTPHALETTGSANGVLGNDADPVEGDPVSITGVVGCADVEAPFVCVLAGIGAVTLEGDGRFSFVPEPGDAGANESFQYILSDGTDTANGTVTLTRFERVWYVADNAAGGGNGTSIAPLNGLASLNGAGGAGDADGAGDYIFVYFGGGAAPGLSGGLVLEGGQHLIGQHAGLSLNVNLNGNGAPTALVAAAAGNRPFVAGDVTATDVIPAEIVGMNLAGSTANAIDWTTTGAFAGTGTFSIRDNVIRSAPAEGVDINLAGTGATNLAFHQNAITSTGTGMDLQETGTGAVTITQFHDNVVNGDGGGSGIIVSTAIFDATPGGGFNTVSGGTTVIGASGNGVGAAGLVLGNVQGDLHFSNLSIFADGGTGLLTTGTGAGMQVRVNTGGGPTGIIEATGGPAVDVSAATLDLRLTGLRSTNSASTGVSLTNVPGTFSAAAGSSITNATGTDFAISGGTANVTYGGTITDDVGQLVSISGATAGTKSFTGAISDGDDGDGSGVSLSGNTGATIRFSGGLVLSTGGNPAFAATGGGTLEVCDENPCNPATRGAFINSITTTTGIALNVSSTSIGANHLELTSVSSSGAPSGIVLNGNAGSTGRLIVGPAMGGPCNSVATCAGGAIQNSTGPAISLTNTRNASFTEMYILNGATHGISGTTMSDATAGVHPTFELRNSFLESPGDGDNESAIFFDAPGVANITGRLVVSSTTIQNFEDVGVHVGNNSGTLVVDLTSMTIHNNSDTNGEEGVDVEASGTARITLNISGGTFSDLEGGGLNAFISSGSGVLDVNLDNAVITGTGGPDNFPTPPAITLSAEGGSSTMTFDITNNSILGSSGDGIFVGHEGSIMGRITGNVVSGMQTGDALRIDTDAAGSNTATILVDGNNFGNAVGNTGIGDDGIQVLHRDGTKQLNLTISNNQIANTASEGIRYFADDDVSGGGPGNNVRVVDNTFTNIGDPNTIVIISQDTGTDVCTHISGNALAGAGVPGITLQQSLAAVLQITQASAAALATANEGAVVTSSGTITFNGACTSTPQPTH